MLLVGCGALGTVLAETLVRAGVGKLCICDRDFVERSNLQRQVLFDEDDIAAHMPKAQAATAKLARINPEVEVRPEVVDVNHTNIERLAEGADLLLDGTDNFETRYLINDLAVKTERPWVYGAVIGATGLCMTIVPHDTPCLRCVFDEAPPADVTPTCDTAGVLAPAVHIVAALQTIEVFKLLTGRASEINRHLVHVDAWSGRLVNMNVASVREGGDCPSCGRGEFVYLDGKQSSTTASLCGRNAVQVHPPSCTPIDLSVMAAKLEPVAGVSLTRNQFLLRATVDSYELTLFPDGRAIIKGTDNPDVARSLYAKYFGA